MKIKKINKKGRMLFLLYILGIIFLLCGHFLYLFGECVSLKTMLISGIIGSLAILPHEFHSLKEKSKNGEVYFGFEFRSLVTFLMIFIGDLICLLYLIFK